MKNHNFPTQRRNFFVSPYLFTLTSLFSLLLIGSGIALACILVPVIDITDPIWFYTIGLLVVTFFAWPILFYLHAYEFGGTVSFTASGIILRAPLRRRIYIDWNHIKDLGLDYGTLSTTKQ